MNIRTFTGGIHVSEKKDTSTSALKSMPLPKKVIIPLLQHTGAPNEPIVKVGDVIKRGQKIGSTDKFVSAPVHASISGTVSMIAQLTHPIGIKVNSIVIDSDGKDEPFKDYGKKDWKNKSIGELKSAIKEAGLVGLGGAAFPTHVKLSPPENKKIDSVIINGAECEPYLTIDHRNILERTEEIIEGAKILLKILNAENAYIAIEINKLDAIKKVGDLISNEKNISVIPLKVKYPQGQEKMLIKAILNREIPSGKLPMDVQCVVQNVGTAIAIYEAAVMDKPLYERGVTVTGSGIKNAENLNVRIGTLFSDVIEFCGGFIGKPAKVIMGGPMMGIAQYTLDVPVVKGTSGILVLEESEFKLYQSSACIRCGRCVQNCPMALEPYLYGLYGENGKFLEMGSASVLDCFECGVCNYVCPAKRPLIQYIKQGKAIILSSKQRSSK